MGVSDFGGISEIIFAKEEHLMYVLDKITEFLSAYSMIKPNYRPVLLISQWQRYKEHSDLGYALFGYIKFKMHIDEHWDELLHICPESAEYVNSTFNYERKDRVYTYMMGIGFSIGCPFPSKRIDAMIQKCLEGYKAEYPEICFMKQ